NQKTLKDIIMSQEYQGSTRLLKRIVDSKEWSTIHIGFLVLTHQGRLYPFVFASSKMIHVLNKIMALKKPKPKQEEQNEKYSMVLLYHSPQKNKKCMEYHW